ncbi:hypothetical protein M422DRAFT_243631 [Sphaerobolus stellatus SS14]|nr:hypothetical protein M422DRAFT_243631 [Sphaerobolus stellatus SS14]
MPPHCKHSPARQECNKKLLIAYIAFNMTQDEEEEEDPVLLALMAWAMRERVAITDVIRNGKYVDLYLGTVLGQDQKD